MTAPHAATGPSGGHRAPRTSDQHRMVIDHVRFHGTLVELAKMWAGRPMRGKTRYEPGEYSCLTTHDEALRAYASNLARCFPMPRRTP